ERSFTYLLYFQIFVRTSKGRIFSSKENN
ncbi:hypothetical protein AVEN_241629-1, partial [Araneus ventricosus]